jgi:hypothetical protein
LVSETNLHGSNNRGEGVKKQENSNKRRQAKNLKVNRSIEGKESNKTITNHRQEL